MRINMLRRYFLTSIPRMAEGAGGGESPPADNGERAGFDPGLAESNFRRALDFDPFTPPAKDGAEGGEGGDSGKKADADPPEGQGEAAGEGSAPKAPAAAPAQPPAGQAQGEGEGDDALAALRQQVQDFLSKKPAPKPAEQQTPAQPAQQPAQPAGAAPAKDQPKYSFEIPDAIVDAFESEDRSHRKAAIGAIVNNLANKLANDFGTALGALQRQIVEQLPQMISGTVETQTTQQKIRADLYDNYPELKRLVTAMPGMEQALWTQIHEVGKQMQVTEWTPEFRDGVAQLIHLNLGLPVVRAQGAAPAPNGGGKPPPKKPPFSAGGSSGGGRPNGADGGSEFLAVLNAGQG